MNEMLERVARAIFIAEIHWPENGIEANWEETCKEDWRKIARAAIEEMREPTEEMATIGCLACEDEVSYHTIQTSWRAMIDAALKD